MADAAGWLALAATCIAALMTASNLGARTTGWGFVVFTIGAAAWIVVGWSTGQKQLLASNLFLGVVDLFGIWRWLGRRARIDDAARAEERRSAAGSGATLFSATKLDGLPVLSRSGDVLATSVDALASCNRGEIAFLIVRAGGVAGVGEALYRLPWAHARVGDGKITTDLSNEAFAALPAVAESTQA